VQFHRLDRRAIDRYLAKIDPLDKAGAYAAQGEGGDIIARIDGSFSNVVGLPMETTTRVLRAFGIVPVRPNESRPGPAATRPAAGAGPVSRFGKGTRQ
jgi:septum formation protein